jgi:hypothetical protein
MSQERLESRFDHRLTLYGRRDEALIGLCTSSTKTKVLSSSLPFDIEVMHIGSDMTRPNIAPEFATSSYNVPTCDCHDAQWIGC